MADEESKEHVVMTQHESKIPREQRELRNTHEARDDEPVFHGDLPQGEGITVHEHQLEPWPNSDPSPAQRWPREGEFMPPKPLAEAVTVQIAAVEQLLKWCGNFRAQPRLRNALDQLEIARDLLRTERHY